MTHPWLRRLATAEDEDGLVYLWLKGYAHAKINIDAGAGRQHTEEERSYWREHAPIVEQLLRHARTEVLVDPARAYASNEGPATIYGFACTSGDVVHWLCIKRQYTRDPDVKELCPDMVRDLLGDRLDRVCRFTHALVEMGCTDPARRDQIRRADCGVKLPAAWWHDPWWVARQLVGGARKERVKGEVAA